MTRALRVIALLVVTGGCAHETHKAPPSSDNEEAAAEKGAAAPAPTSEPSAAGGVQVPPTTQPASGPPPKPLPPKIKIIVRAKGVEKTDKVLVFWGKKKLGEPPVTLERPRDSGPVDLVVRSEGYFPVHTRAYTFRNDVLYVKLTKLDDRMTLFGAKHDVNEAPPGGVPDGGVPPATVAAPATSPPPPAPAQ